MTNEEEIETRYYECDSKQQNDKFDDLILSSIGLCLDWQPSQPCFNLLASSGCLSRRVGSAVSFRSGKLERMSPAMRRLIEKTFDEPYPAGKGRHEEAYRVLRKLRGKNADIEDEFNAIKASGKEVGSEGCKFKDPFQGPFRIIAPKFGPNSQITTYRYSSFHHPQSSGRSFPPEKTTRRCHVHGVPADRRYQHGKLELPLPNNLLTLAKT